METNQEVLINRYVLAFLFQVWSGPSWKDNLGWLSPTPECDWYGISCEENAIVGLELGGNSLASTTDDDNGLPSELFTLTSLKTFNASASALRGSIPFEVSSLVNLEVLDLGSSQNRLGKYRDELFSLPNLRVLDLAYPTGGSSIPTYVGLLSRLEILNAAQAGLFGVLPTELGGATSLVTIVLHSNGITGTVPTELGLLTNVHHLDLASNLLGETIPFEIGNMVQLRNLDLGVNAFRGAIPPHVAALPHLEQLRLRENRLTGTIPIELLDSGRMLCFDASSNSQMDNSIPQGQCIQGAAQMAVACEDESDQACSCCVCWRTGSVEYCKQIVL
jgi:Leucine-rich repeat (LRR) protein